MYPSPQQVNVMRERITDEVFFALGFSRNGAARRLLGRLFYLPTQRFARIFAAADEAASREGLPGGGRSLVRDLGIQLRTQGQEHIPAEGPLLLVSNHPGAYDSAAIAACTGRADLNILVAETSFYHALPNIGQGLICAGNQPHSRMPALRQAIRHLQKGGALLQFATGTIDADPALQADAEADLEKWSPSLELMLRHAPGTSVMLVIASGVLLEHFARHPLARMQRVPLKRRRLAEFMQLIQQMLRPASVQARAALSFSAVIAPEEWEAEAAKDGLMPFLRSRGRQLLMQHMERLRAGG